MDAIRKKFPNHTEIAYREAVSKLKYLLAESYAPKISIRPTTYGRKYYKDKIIPESEDYAEDVEIQSVVSDVSKKDPHRLKNTYCMSRLSQFPSQQTQSVPPTELTSFIERQEEYIEQLERESQYCKDELKNLIEKVREVIAENEALQERVKPGFLRTVIENEDEPTRVRLEGPSIVFESRISELEAQLTQARVELRKVREENQENLERLCQRRDEVETQRELDRTSREKRELEVKLDEVQKELNKFKARDLEIDIKCKRAAELAQQAEFERNQAEAEVRRLKEELERRQEKLREALQETNRRAIEEKQQVERRFSQQVEQLSADVATHWEAASKSHLESEKQRREIADLKRELTQKQTFIDDLKKELQAKTSKMQEELNEAIAEKDASQEEIATVKLSAERNERQARQEQSRLQSEINSYKMRLERADADLVHARRENLRLTEEIAALEKEINMKKIVEETRVASQPSKLDEGIDEKSKDKELASLIFDLESKQAKTIASLEDTMNKQALLVSRLTAECQSLTHRLEANDQKHKKEMANLQSNIEYLSNKVSESIEHRDQNSDIVGDNVQSSIGNRETSSEVTSENDLRSNLQKQQSKDQLSNEGTHETSQNIDYSNYQTKPGEEQLFTEQQETYGDDYTNQHYNQYNQYDPAQYQQYFSNQPYNENQDYTQNQEYYQNEPYNVDKDNYKNEPYEQNYQSYSKVEEK